MELCGQSTTPTETYEVSGSEIGEAYLHIHLSRAIVLLGLGVGLCVTHLNHKDKLTWLSIFFALVFVCTMELCRQSTTPTETYEFDGTGWTEIKSVL